MSECGEPVQVVRAEEAGEAGEGGGGRYRLDEAALAGVLLAEAADCPVAVLSVAGAYRGGKSFLLDYFLRYLQAEENSRRDRSWVSAGDEHAPLSGFSWSNDSERNTDGLLLWSKPFKILRPSGEPVCVLLVDTQGAFDWSSSLRDCSTVFALSTLLSSVQVYNLTRDVRADDLQHLQLFTKYGRLAAETGDAVPFQSLKFLVRDWSFPRNYAYGNKGGRLLLESRVQAMEGVPELTDLWESIQASFESVECFLMAHPGLRVQNCDFDGRVSDLSDEFRAGLLELTTTVLDPQNLTPKTIGGQAVTGRQLFHYFKSYLDIFNSDETPTPMTILQATAAAGLLAHAASARAQFRRDMDEACSGDASLARSALRQRHKQVLESTLTTFSETRLMADAEEIASTLEKLTQELEKELEYYEAINNTKISRNIAVSEAIYEERLSSVAPLSELCLHPQDLALLHREAAHAAAARFEDFRAGPHLDEEDEDLEVLIQFMNERYIEVCEWNKANNIAAVSASLAEYRGLMTSALSEQPCVDPARINRRHETSRAAAKRCLLAKRSRNSEHAVDTYKTQLERDMERILSRLHKTNESNNESAVVAAVATYNRRMTTMCAAHAPCLHPQHLRDEDQQAAAEALREFRGRRTYEEGDDEDDAYKQRVELELDRNHTQYYEMNQNKNQTAVYNAMRNFDDSMEEFCNISLLNPLNTCVTAMRFNEKYAACVVETRQQFFRFRREPPINYATDGFLDTLLRAMENRQTYYWKKLFKDTLVAGAAVAAGTLAAGAAAATGAVAAGLIKK